MSEYKIDQCPLYKMQSKKRLAKVMFCSVKDLQALRLGPHYKLFKIEKPPCPFTGKVTKPRDVQEPKVGLRQVHERLQRLLTRIHPPEYAHGAIEGKSYKSNAEAHLGYRRVATFDLKQFYPSTSKVIVFDFFKNYMKCAPDISSLLADLACYGNSLSTGSPLSPILSVFANRVMFDQLEKIAKTHSLAFTVYIDDLTYSGASLPRGLPRMVASTVEKFGHLLAEKKTAIYRRNQPKHITGVVVNGSQISVPKSRFHKARKIQAALKSESNLEKKLKISQKLSGLLGETAHLDSKYSRWAKASYKKQAAIAQKIALLPKITVSKVKSAAPSNIGLPPF